MRVCVYLGARTYNHNHVRWDWISFCQTHWVCQACRSALRDPVCSVGHVLALVCAWLCTCVCTQEKFGSNPNVRGTAKEEL